MISNELHGMTYSHWLISYAAARFCFQLCGKTDFRGKINMQHNFVVVDHCKKWDNEQDSEIGVIFRVHIMTFGLD